MNTLIDSTIPDNVKKGKFLFQPSTGRWYSFTEALAGRTDMHLYNDGVQIPNPFQGMNTSQHQMDKKTAVTVNENDALKSQIDTLTQQVKQLTALVGQTTQTDSSTPPPVFTNPVNV